MLSQKRRRFWIDPPLQIQMLATVMVLVIGSIFLIIYSVIHGLEEASLQSRQIFHSLDWVLENVRRPMLISASIAVLASALVSLVWSHRFAGPLRVLCAAFSRLSKGNFSVPIRVRQSDTHQELIKDFAQMQERLHERLSADLSSIASAADRLKALQSRLRDDHEAHKEIKAVTEQLEALGSRYLL